MAIYHYYEQVYGEEASNCFALGIAGVLALGGWKVSSKLSVYLLTVIAIKGYIEGIDKP